MTGPAKDAKAPPTAVAAVPSERQMYLQQAKERTALIASIRGTQWGSQCSPEVVRAVAHYCNMNGLDAVRHVEVLGGRIYLTAEFYREQGAELLLNGLIVPDEPVLIHHDERLDLLVQREDSTGAWAKAELERRIQARIQYGVDEDSPGAAIVRFRLKSGATIIGVNWIGGKESKKKDPVGNAEPAKTAITRAERRAWRQVVEAIPEFRDKVQHIEVRAKLATAEVAEIRAEEEEAEPPKHPTPLLKHGDNAYETGVATEPAAEPAAEPVPENRTQEDEDFELELDRED